MKRLFKFFVPRDFTFTRFTHSLSGFLRNRMKFCVRFTLFNYHKVFDSIIISNMINMVNNFGRFKISPQVFFHDKSMFFNKVVAIFKGVVGAINKNISLMFSPSFKPTMLASFLERSRVLFHNTKCSFVPRNTSFSKLISFSHKTGTFNRAIFPSWNLILGNIKIFIAKKANFFKKMFLSPRLFMPFNKTTSFISNHNRNLLFKFSFIFTLISILQLTIMSSPVLSINKWRDDSTSFFDGDTTYFNTIDTEVDDHIIEPLERYLLNARQGMKLSYASTSTLTVGTGSIGCANAAGTLVEIRRNTSSTAVAWSDIDTGAEAGSTTYYVYANCDADATTATFKISASASAPTGVTSYKKIGSFYNDSSSNILNDETITNDNNYYALQLGDWVSKSNGVTYQATTDGFFIGYGSGSPNSSVAGYTDASSSPTTIRGYNSLDDQNGTGRACVTVPVKKNDYWKTDGASVSVYWLPLE